MFHLSQLSKVNPSERRRESKYLLETVTKLESELSFWGILSKLQVQKQH